MEVKDIVYIKAKKPFIDCEVIEEKLVSHVNVNNLYDVRILNINYY